MSPIDPHNRWLPPSPHREKVLETIQRGRAHVEEQGHGKPPLLIYEDGGVMELPQYRWMDGKAIAANGSDPARQTTQFLDVCGTIDELKRLLQNEPEMAVQNPERLFQLLDDALAMIDRMFIRLERYHTFREKVQEQLRRMERLTGPTQSQAAENAVALRDRLSQEPENVPASLEMLFEHAENVREVAQRLEENLYPLRDACIEIFRLYEEVRGAREWNEKRE